MSLGLSLGGGLGGVSVGQSLGRRLILRLDDGSVVADVSRLPKEDRPEASRANGARSSRAAGPAPAPPPLPLRRPPRLTTPLVLLSLPFFSHTSSKSPPLRLIRRSAPSPPTLATQKKNLRRTLTSVSLPAAPWSSV